MINLTSVLNWTNKDFIKLRKMKIKQLNMMTWLKSHNKITIHSSTICSTQPLKKNKYHYMTTIFWIYLYISQHKKHTVQPFTGQLTHIHQNYPLTRYVTRRSRLSLTLQHTAVLQTPHTWLILLAHRWYHALNLHTAYIQISNTHHTLGSTLKAHSLVPHTYSHTSFPQHKSSSPAHSLHTTPYTW